MLIACVNDKLTLTPHLIQKVNCC